MGLPSDQPGSAEGHAFAALQSRRIPARLIWQGDAVRLEDAGGTLLVAGPVQRIQQMSGGPTLVHLPGGWLFEAVPAADLQGLRGPRPDGWLTHIEAWHPRLAAVALLCLLAAYTVWRWGLDVLVALALAVTPEAPVRAIDASNMAFIDRAMAYDTTIGPQRQAEVLAIFDRLTKVAPPAPWGDYRLLFRDMPTVGPNAFAMPGGTIVITDDLIRDFPDDDVIAGVLGHEMAHVSERHVLAQLYRAGTTYLLITLIAGDPGPFLQDALAEGSALVSLSYSRRQEGQADMLGVGTASAAGHDGTALADFFQALRDQHGDADLGWLSTHPALGDRIERIRALSGE